MMNGRQLSLGTGKLISISNKSSIHCTSVHLSSALTGAAITTLALAEPFIAAGAAVAFWFFFATEKELSPRGYERNEILNASWVPPSTRKIQFFFTAPP
jgi:hypothetical protein